MRLIVCVLAGAITLGSAGCRTLDSYESIPVKSEPPGADVVVQCGEIHQTTVTPGNIFLARSAPDCRVAIRKDGYVEEVVWLRRGSTDSAWVSTLALAAVGGGVLITSPSGGGADVEAAGEIMISGLIPWIVSIATCNHCDHEPKSLAVLLRPRPADEPVVASR